MTTFDRDALLRAALAPAPDAAAPADLGDAILDEIVATPQRRAGLRLGPIGRVAWLPAPSPFGLVLVVLALLALAILAVALAKPQRPVLSTYHGGPDRTGVMPGPGPAGIPVIAWDVPRPAPIPFTSMPLPIGDRVLVADTGGTVAALAATTGAPLWEQNVGSAVNGAPTTIGKDVVMGTAAGEVVALNIESSAEAWRQQLGNGAVDATLLAVEDVVYAGTSGGRLFALAASDGHVLWSVDVGAAVTRGPSLSAGVLYVPTHAGTLWAIDATTHAVRWSRSLTPGDVGTPTIVGNLVYVGEGLKGDGPDHAILALDTADGHTTWSFPAPDGAQVYGGAVTDGRVYAASDSGILYLLDAATGRMLWQSELGGRLTTLSNVVDNVVYVSSRDRAVHAVDRATGRELWDIPVTGEPTMPAILDGRVFVGTTLGRVTALADRAASEAP
jgi:outer membrane protein assembly factor BamB